MGAEMSSITGLVDAAERELATKLSSNLPTLDEALSRLQSAGEAGHVDADEQQRLLMRLGKVVKRMDDTKKKKRELEVAQLAAQSYEAQRAKLEQQERERVEYEKNKQNLKKEPTGIKVAGEGGKGGN